MREIKELVERIDDELAGAKKYAELAQEQRYITPDLSALYESHAYEELHHADELHTEAVIMIKRARAEGEKPTQEMLDRWNEEHKTYISKAAEIKAILSE